jgi:hypothetical protein
MKKTIVLFLALGVFGCSGAQDSPTPRWTMTLRVLGDEGQPLPDARVWVAYSDPKEGESLDPLRPNGWAVGGFTDTNGMFSATHENTRSSSLGLHIQKDGYYPTVVVYELGAGYDPKQWNLSPTWVVKRIRDPIPMYAKSVRTVPPTGVESAGYDFMSGDWVSPYGKGKTTDVVVKRSPGSGWMISFPNAGDGIQAFTNPPTRFPGDGSALRSPHKAPEGGYESELVRKDYNENGNYFIRVRTVLDSQGQVKRALYGKIYGDFMRFRYYLNPKANDLNVEFDPKHNLLTGLKSFEQVGAP